jgi:hypothetical protein
MKTVYVFFVILSLVSCKTKQKISEHIQITSLEQEQITKNQIEKTQTNTIGETETIIFELDSVVHIPLENLLPSSLISVPIPIKKITYTRKKEQKEEIKASSRIEEIKKKTKTELKKELKTVEKKEPSRFISIICVLFLYYIVVFIVYLLLRSKLKN